MNNMISIRAGWLGLLASVLFLAACGEQPDSPTVTQVQREATSHVPKPASGPAKYDSPQDIVGSFKRDLAACRDIVRHRPDPSQEPKIDFKTPERVLDVAPYAGTPEASYIKANGDYVVLWITYHHDPFAISRLLESEPLFCGLSTKRMEEMDRSAAPEEGWDIREHFLNIGINNLETVLDIGPGGDAIRWSWLQSQLELAEQLYLKTHREKLLEISIKTASQIEQLVAHDNRIFEEMYGDQKGSTDVLKARADLDKEIVDRKRFIQAMIERLKKT